jgi:hypothetical protein
VLADGAGVAGVAEASSILADPIARAVLLTWEGKASAAVRANPPRVTDTLVLAAAAVVGTVVRARGILDGDLAVLAQPLWEAATLGVDAHAVQAAIRKTCALGTVLSHPPLLTVALTKLRALPTSIAVVKAGLLRAVEAGVLGVAVAHGIAAKTVI